MSSSAQLPMPEQSITECDVLLVIEAIWAVSYVGVLARLVNGVPLPEDMPNVAKELRLVSLFRVVKERDFSTLEMTSKTDEEIKSISEVT